MLRKIISSLNEGEKITRNSEIHEVMMDYLVAPVDSKLEQKYGSGDFKEFYRKDNLHKVDAFGCVAGDKSVDGRLLMAAQPYRKIEKIIEPDKLGRDFAIEDIEGMETLARIFNVRKQTLFSAGAIFKLLNETQIAELDMRMMEQSIDLARAVNLNGRGRKTVAANFNGYTLWNGNFAFDIISKLDSCDLPTDVLAVELLESTHELNYAQINQLKQVVKRGVKIVIDDFGQERSEDLFRQLIKYKVKIDTVKFDGKDINGFNEETQERCLDLMRMAYENEIVNVVWEGNFKGVPFERIAVLRNYLEGAPSVISQDMKHLFEGLVV